MNRREFFKGILGVGAIGALAILPKETVAKPVPAGPPITHQYSPYEVVHEVAGRPDARHAACLFFHSGSQEHMDAVWKPVYQAFRKAKKHDGVYYSVTQAKPS